MLNKTEYARLVAAWLLGGSGAYFLVSYIATSALNPGLYHHLLLGLFFAILLGSLAYFGLPKLAWGSTFEWLKHNWPCVMAVLLVARFAFRVGQLSFSFPTLLSPQEFLLAANAWPAFGAAVLLALALLWLLFRRPSDWNGTMHAPLQHHWLGLLLAVLFFATYLLLANVFNRTDFNTNNVFFAADTNSWMLRLTDPSGPSMGMRAVHPLAFILLRPVVDAASFVLGTQPFNALLLLVAGVGSASVFLVWYIVVRLTNEANFACLVAALFGVSSASLVFNSLVETYLFSGFFLLLFLALLVREAKLVWLLVAGVLTFGITISNLAQSVFVFFANNPNVRKTLTLIALVLVVAAALNLLNTLFFPQSGFFFDPTDLSGETQSIQLGETAEEWQGRAGVVSSNVFLFSVVSPEPFLVATNREARGEFPKFYSMLGDRPAALVGTGRYAAWLWGGILAAALFSFVASLRKDKFSQANRLGLALLGCVLFNFALHLFYGFEPFLYAADWTYALILFVAIGLRPHAHTRWLQGALLIQVALLTLNNLSFLSYLMRGIQPYISALS